ncbi:endoglucanase [Kribbella sp. VKM Ac-2571]|uniref:glycoside hydrolase family 6 protein n=1 Tax=Kribbella sp. VKM Ac-2571 TaxID=2512222 RepID=UPI0010605947|nr:glycoside hydrolase family 6 protein [Kribbella sp. VKM Ac-2571]TDO68168.1 endoglucanase [Kribbella sp. VKM Ac-2571]
MPTTRPVVAFLVLTAALLVFGRPDSGLAEATGDPLKLTTGFYVDPASPAAAYARRHPEDTELATKIAAQASARWVGAWSGDVKAGVTAYTTAADTAGKLPVLVTDNLPGRQCGIGGGAATDAAYRAWIAAVSDGIGTRPAVVVLEPDALARLDCYPTSEWDGRIALLKYAVGVFATKNPNTWTYLDAGNVTSGDAKEMARRLRLADIGKVRGFALNTANYFTTEQSAARGAEILQALGGGTHYVIDTSRNGNGSDGSSCNPPARKLGTPPARTPAPVDLHLWLRTPGESDGPCGLTPDLPTRTFSPVLAHHLITGT